MGGFRNRPSQTGATDAANSTAAGSEPFTGAASSILRIESMHSVVAGIGCI